VTETFGDQIYIDVLLKKGWAAGDQLVNNPYLWHPLPSQQLDGI
jgi:hypothetical protein